MRLSEFITSSTEEILVEWDKFARTLFSEEDKNKTYLLRDHAREILLELTADMETSQSLKQQVDKSKGVVSPYHPDDSAANVHGVLRHDEGFTVSQVAAEFRALRASVLRLWLPKISVMSKEVVIDIVRFNESIDEALADSIVTYRG
ncbi:MAG: RsbRD N-terminal domain-containing protein [Burkholderiaceae bacterium]